MKAWWALLLTACGSGDADLLDDVGRAFAGCDPEEIARQWQVDRRFMPRLPEPQRLAKLARWRDAVNRAKGWTI